MELLKRLVGFIEMDWLYLAEILEYEIGGAVVTGITFERAFVREVIMSPMGYVDFKVDVDWGRYEGWFVFEASAEDTNGETLFELCSNETVERLSTVLIMICSSEADG